MKTDAEPRRLTPTERLQRLTEQLHEVTMAAMNRRTAPESSVTIGVTAKRLHTWEITVRGEDVEECHRLARLLDDGLAEKYKAEMETGDTITARARS
jgi:phosphoribosyl-dephospho-CoA transferase